MPGNNTDTVENNHNHSRALFRGVISGVVVPFGTVPIDRATTHFQVNDQLKFLKLETWLKLTAKTGPGFAPTALWNGYPFTVSANIVRYLLSYTCSPFVEKQAKRFGVNDSRARFFGNTTSGFLDGVVSGPFNVIRQAYFTDRANIHKTVNLFSKEARTQLRKKSLLASPYVVVRNTVYWPIYNELARFGEQQLKVTKEENNSLQNSKALLAGAAAGSVTTIITHPLDALRVIQVENAGLTLKQLRQKSYKEHGLNAVYKLLYRGVGLSAFVRAPIGMGLTNWARHAADSAHSEYTKPSKKL